MLLEFNFISHWLKRIPVSVQLKLFGLAKIPLLLLVGPKVQRMDVEICEVKIPLNYLTRNHLKSMYFGTMAIGADCVVAVHALHIAQQMTGVSIVPVFKNFHADFHKRAEGAVVFRCAAGAQIAAMIEKALASGERVTENVPIEGICNGEIVANFTLGLSLRAKKDT